MKRESFSQYRIVQGDTAARLTEELNAAIYELRHRHPTVTFEGLIARIEYTEKESTPESLGDEYEVQGARFTCQDCPYFEPVRKADGTEDGRAKWGGCEHKDLGRTYKDSAACDYLFTQIRNGRVRLCLAE